MTESGGTGQATKSRLRRDTRRTPKERRSGTHGVPPMPDVWIGRPGAGEVFASRTSPSRHPDPAVRAFFEAADDAGAEVLHAPWA